MMVKTKEYKTISFRADPETVVLLDQLKKQASNAFGVSVSVSDLLRLALADYSENWQKKDVKENG